jgi:hypothetical protein
MLGLVSLTLRADADWRTLAARWPQAMAVVEDSSIAYDVADDGKYLSLRHYRATILRQPGAAQLATFSDNYYDQYEHMTVKRAVVIGPDGQETAVGADNIKDLPMPADDDGYIQNLRLVLVTFPQLQVGATVEVELEAARNAPPMDRAFSLAAPLQGGLPRLHQAVSVTLPAGMPLAWKVYRGEARFSQQTGNGRVTDRWEMGEQPPIVAEPDMPPEVEVVPTLAASTIPSWKAVSRWYANLCRQGQARLGELLPLDAGRPALLATASGGRAITTPAADPRRQFVHARWQLALDGRGDLAGSLTLRFGGLFDQQLRERLIACTPEERAVLLQTLVGRIKPGARLAGFQVSDLRDLTRPPVVHLELRIPAFAHRQGALMILDLPGDLTPLGDPLVQPIDPAVRHPFLVPASYTMSAELVLRLPAGYGIAHQPRNLGVRQGPFAFRIACVGRPGRLLLNSAIAWRRAVVRPKAYPALWRAFSAASGPAHGLILLERTGQTRAAREGAGSVRCKATSPGGLPG